MVIEKNMLTHDHGQNSKRQAGDESSDNEHGNIDCSCLENAADDSDESSEHACSFSRDLVCQVPSKDSTKKGFGRMGTQDKTGPSAQAGQMLNAQHTAAAEATNNAPLNSRRGVVELLYKIGLCDR